MPFIPVLEGRGRQLSEFEVSQGYIGTPCLKTNNNNNKTVGEEEEWAGPRGPLLVSGCRVGWAKESITNPTLRAV